MIRILQEENREDRAAIFAPAVSEVDVSATVREIIARVRSEGDAALYAYGERFDRVRLDALEVSREVFNA